MTMHYRTGGVWKEITSPEVRVSGVWKEITEGWVNVSGVWKQFYSRIAFSIPTVNENVTGDPSACGVKMRRNGQYESGSVSGSTTIFYSDVSATAWVDPEEATIGDGYHCRLVTSSGTLDVGTADTWLALTSDRTFEAYAGTVFSGTMQLSDDGGSTVIASGGVTLTPSPL